MINDCFNCCYHIKTSFELYVYDYEKLLTHVWPLINVQFSKVQHAAVGKPCIMGPFTVETFRAVW